MKTQLKVGRDRETEAHLFDIVMAVTFRKLKRRVGKKFGWGGLNESATGTGELHGFENS
jgi:hypothetical protein